MRFTLIDLKCQCSWISIAAINHSIQPVLRAALWNWMSHWNVAITDSLCPRSQACGCACRSWQPNPYHE